MNVVSDVMIDFDKYAREPEEASHIRPASSWVDDVIDRFHGSGTTPGAVLPWSKTHSHLRLRPHEVTVWAGYNGSGKTMLLNQIMLAVMAQGERVCTASFEMTPQSLLARMTRQAIGVREPTIQAIRQFHDWTDGRLWLYDHGNVANPKRVLAVCRYCREEMQIDHIVIDSLMKCGIDTDDFNTQKRFVDELCVHARDTGMHVHLVAHGRKGDSEKKQLDKHDVKGAGEITDLVDNVFTVWRNKPKEEAIRNKPEPDDKLFGEPDMVLSCVKNRHGEWEGPVFLWFEPESLQYTAKLGARAIDFLGTFARAFDMHASTVD
jgi:twinkle protein